MRTSARRPKLGQHFLRDEEYARRIANLIPAEPGDLVIEIGAGRGAMTRLLAGRARVLIAVEIDPKLAGALRVNFPGPAHVEVLEQDILDVSLTRLCELHDASQCLVIGNIPYYITSPILHHLLAQRSSIRRMALMTQLEVARRVTAAPGSRDYGYLSVAVQSASRPRIAFEIPPGAFTPPPKVDSAVVDFQMIAPFPGWAENRRVEFLEFAERCFSQKRKSLVNNLSRAYGRPRVEAALSERCLSPLTRAEEMPVQALAGLFQSLVPCK